MKAQAKKRFRALCVNPPVYDFAFYDLYSKPYGLMRIARWLRKGGYEVEVLNCLDYTDQGSIIRFGKPKRHCDGTGKVFRRTVTAPVPFPGVERAYARYGISTESITGCLRTFQPDVVLVTTGMTYWYPGVAEMAGLLQRYLPGVPVLYGGIYASLLPEHCRGITGSPYIQTGPGVSKIGKLLTEAGFPAPRGGLDELVEYDSRVWQDAGVVRLNRGCPFSCAYCAARQLEPRFSLTPLEQSITNTKMFYRHGIRNIAFYDDALLVRREKTLYPYLRIVREKMPELRFFLPNAVHADFLDDEAARWFFVAGFPQVRLGLESAAPRFHRTIDSKVSTRGFQRAVENLFRAGYKHGQVGAYLLCGLPRQKAEEVERSIRFAHSRGVVVYLSEYSPIPNTTLWDTSCRESRYPLGEEPLYQNNTILPLAWEGFTGEDYRHLKREVRGFRRKQGFIPGEKPENDDG